MTVFWPFCKYGFLIKLVSGDRGFLSNVTGEFDELFVVELKFVAKFPIPPPFMEIGEMIWEWDLLMLVCGLIRIKFELLRLLGLCKTDAWGPDRRIGLCTSEFPDPVVAVLRILALSASQALLKSSNDVGAGLFSVKLSLSKLNPGRNRFLEVLPNLQSWICDNL